MNYSNNILNRLLDMYERRGAFDKDASSLRAIQIEVKKVYPEYGNRYNHEVYKDINLAIETLSRAGYVIAAPDNAGQYSKVRLNADSIQKCYVVLKRESIPAQCDKVKTVLSRYLNYENEMLNKILQDWTTVLDECKKLPYDLKLDAKRVSAVLDTLIAIMNLNTETYIRNFSTALYKDSKKFQKEFRGTVESILFDYTDEVVEKDEILGFYNLYENPTYVMIKGAAIIKFESSIIDVSEMKDGIALSNASLENIKEIAVNACRVITVENLTTYHDSNEIDAVHIYLGGYHNHSKQELLEKIYRDNKEKSYFHKGDLDVYGFFILENLKRKTGIPFEPLMMDVQTLERFYSAGLYKGLTQGDKKAIEKNIGARLAEYENVLRFMLDHDCKVEQESIRAVELIE